MNRIQLLLAVVTTILSTAATAQVHRCQDASGKISYSDAPCAPHQQGTLIERQRTQAEIYEERMRAAEANERKYRQQQAEAMRSNAAMPQRQSAAANTASNAAQDKANTPECKAAKRDLEIASSSRTAKESEKRQRMNAAIGKVNIDCGTNMAMIAEPHKVINQGPDLVLMPNGRQCQRLGGGTYQCY
ncbi:MAG: DUF4124 domain-containing protein [Burkholderiaceae bacterium]